MNLLTGEEQEKIERLEKLQLRYKDLLNQNQISQETYNTAIEKIKKDLEVILKRAENRLFGISDEEERKI